MGCNLALVEVYEAIFSSLTKFPLTCRFNNWLSGLLVLNTEMGFVIPVFV